MTLESYLARPGETLIQHTLAVVARADHLHKLHPLLQFPQLHDCLKLAAWFHDNGKLARGFQKQLSSPRQRWGLRHEVLSLAFLDWLDLAPEQMRWVALAIATHHKDLSFILDRYRAQNQLEAVLVEDVDERAVTQWYQWLGEQGVSLKPFSALKASSIRKRLDDLDGWQQRFLDYGATDFELQEAVLLRGLLTQADHAAAAGVMLKGRAAIAHSLISEAERYPHQRDILHVVGVSAQLIAPTGAGKTDAAQIWARASNPPRFIYMLPYRVSMNAMHARLKDVVPDIGLEHGRALSALYRDLLEGGSSSKDAELHARRRRALGRLHATTGFICSPYQLLKTVYRFPGYEARLVDYLDACLIVDEIHAYDPERLALILGALAFVQRYFNTRILLMTATMPNAVRSAVSLTLGELPQITAAAATYQAFQRHRVWTPPGDLLDHLQLPIEQARAGNAVLIVCNTVRRARQAAEQINAQNIDTLLLHGRFNYRDRWQLEKKLLAYFGPDGVRPDYPLIVVATQVIEVSLDVDFDILYSDPAPLDALVQRFGRVNRRRRMPELAVVTVFDEPTGAEDRFSIYDPPLVQASVALLKRYDGQPVDESRIAAWLDEVYSHAGDWMSQFHAAYDHFQRWVLDDFLPLESADIGLRQQFNRLIDECPVLPIDLEDDYLTLKNSQPIEADELLVSLSWWQYSMLERDGRGWKGEGDNDGLFFVDAPYDSQLGLQLYADEED